MKQRLKYLQYPFLKAEIEKMGYALEGGVIAKTALILYLGTALIVYFYQLQLPYLMTLLLIATLSFPYRILSYYKNQYEKKKYFDLTVYLEQMLYSFKRHPKILDALKDTKTVFVGGQMQGLIEQAIAMIQKGAGQNLYQDALGIVETEYGCQRLRTLHRFLAKVEQRGGRYKQTADLLLNDLERWKTSNGLLDKEKKGRRQAILIVIAATFIICGVLTSVYGAMAAVAVTNKSMYQVVCVIFVSINLLLWLISADKLGGSWEFKETMVAEETTLKEYELLQAYDLAAAQKKAKLFALIPGAMTIIGIVLRSIPLILFGAYGTYFLLMSPKSRLEGAKKKVAKEIQKVFPQWLMELTLLLQTENVPVSLYQSLTQVPAIMHREIELLLAEIDRAPNRIEPYHAFFQVLHMEDVITSMKILYSISAFDNMEGGTESPIANLIQRNGIMMSKAEQMGGQEKLAIWTGLTYLPMAGGGIKIIMDMVLLVGSLLTVVGQIV
jgi:hypothetical protein